jgi:hypothetical protein
LQEALVQDQGAGCQLSGWTPADIDQRDSFVQGDGLGGDRMYLKEPEL